MKTNWLKLSLTLSTLLSMSLIAEPIGEIAEYNLNGSSDRTSWLIRSGEGKATVAEYRDHETLGPSYVVSIDYSFEVRFMGRKSGNIGLLVPVAMFEDQFYDDLKNTHPVDLGAFNVDYEGMSSARDNENNAYNECMMIRLFDIDPSYKPLVGPTPTTTLLWHNSSGPGSIEDLELNLKTHATVPVLRAVQIDISGKARGFDFYAGLDYLPQ